MAYIETQRVALVHKGLLKPGVDWIAIEQRIKNGESSNSISKDFDVSRQAIYKRAKGLGWTRTQKTVRIARGNANTVEGKPLATYATYKKEGATNTATLQKPVQHKQMFVKDTPENRDAILALLREGSPRLVACQCAGVSIDSLNRWIQADEDFALLVRQAESVAVQGRLQNIKKAGERGDWKADSWYLERTQRQIFGNENNKLGAVNLQINITRDTGTEPVVVNPVSIDNPSVSES